MLLLPYTSLIIFVKIILSSVLYLILLNLVYTSVLLAAIAVPLYIKLPVYFEK
jgi:hypothetical protein